MTAANILTEGIQGQGSVAYGNASQEALANYGADIIKDFNKDMGVEFSKSALNVGLNLNNG